MRLPAPPALSLLSSGLLCGEPYMRPTYQSQHGGDCGLERFPHDSKFQSSPQESTQSVEDSHSWEVRTTQPTPPVTWTLPSPSQEKAGNPCNSPTREVLLPRPYHVQGESHTLKVTEQVKNRARTWYPFLPSPRLPKPSSISILSSHPSAKQRL